MLVLIKGPISRTIYFMGWCLFGPVQAVLGCMVYIVAILLMVLIKIICYIPIIYIADIAIDLLIKITIFLSKTIISLINVVGGDIPRALWQTKTHMKITQILVK